MLYHKRFNFLAKLKNSLLGTVLYVIKKGQREPSPMALSKNLTLLLQKRGFFTFFLEHAGAEAYF